MSFSEFQKNSRRMAWQEAGLLLLLVVGLLLILGALIYGNYYLAQTQPSGGEFLLLRESGSSFLFDHIPPYSANVPSIVQEQVYGRAALPGEKPYILDIPFHLLMGFLPLALFRDPVVARTFWYAVLEIALFAFAFLGFRLVSWLRLGVFTVLYFALVLFSFYSIRVILEGDPVVLLGLAYVGILLALRFEMDELAGALMVFASFRWEVGGLLLVFILLMVFQQKRWRILMGYGMFAFLLLVVSFLWYPGWFLPFLQAVSSNLRVEYGFSSHDILNQLWPGNGNLLGWILTGLLFIVIGFEWNASSSGANAHRVYWTACLTLAVTPLLGFHSELTNLFVLTLPFALIMAVTRQRWKEVGSLLAALFFLFVLSIPWFLSSSGYTGLNLTTEELLFLFMPVVTVFGLYWIRWWAIRPPRTWLEEVQTQ